MSSKKNPKENAPTQAEVDEALGVMNSVLKEVIPEEKYTLTASIDGAGVAFKFESDSQAALGAWKLLTSVMMSMQIGNPGAE